MDTDQDLVTLEYRFRLAAGTERLFVVHLRKPGLDPIVRPPEDLPDWTRLTHYQCANCPLDPARRPRCPVAVNLVDVIHFFKDCYSTDEAEIIVTVEAREYRRRAPVQYGLTSLMGLLMATGGCPIMDKLRPMVHTHLPFATLEETMYRAASMYLLAQFYLHQQGRPADWDLEHLTELFLEVGQINQAFARRLVSINPKDASLNALANLDCFALATSFSIEKDQLKELETLFHAYL